MILQPSTLFTVRRLAAVPAHHAIFVQGCQGSLWVVVGD